MNEFSWPYVSHDKELFLSKIILAESYLQKFGAKYIGKMNEIGRWFSQDGFYAIEHMEKFGNSKKNMSEWTEYTLRKNLLSFWSFLRRKKGHIKMLTRFLMICPSWILSRK